jgi:ribosomal protein S18 acetylase RimI-like enzyme
MPRFDPYAIMRSPLYMLWPAEPLAAPPAVTLPTQYRLRPYRSGDDNAYCDLVNLDGWADSGWHCQERTLRTMLYRTLPAGLLLVEEVTGGALVATAAARHRPDGDYYFFPFGGEISVVFVHPDHRRRGLGCAVTAAAVTRLIAAGYSTIYLSTMDERQPAIHLYLSMGFVPFLYEDDQPARWQAICARLGRPFTPEAWPADISDQ